MEVKKNAMRQMAKIWLAMAVGCVTLLAGCVTGHDVNINNPVELRLRAVMNLNTRASAGFDKRFPLTTDFGVWAYELPRNKKWAVFYPDAEEVVANERFVGSAVDSLWHPLESLTWNYPQSMTLIAYAPYGLDCRYDHKHGIILDDFDIEQHAGVDVMYTDFVEDRFAERSTLGVDMPFCHALAKVDIKMRTPLQTPVVVHRIEFEGVHTQGSFRSHPLPTWETNDERRNAILYDSEEGWELPLRNYQRVEGSEHLLMPQAAAVRIRVVADLAVGGFGVMDKEFVTDPINILWEPGKYYTYTIEFSQESISIDEPNTEDLE